MTELKHNHLRHEKTKTQTDMTKIKKITKELS